MAFFCDGTTEAAPVLWGWFNGNVKNNAFDLTNERGDRLAGEFNADGASGAITLANGSALHFQAEQVSQPAGLYRHQVTVEGVEIVTGWIVLADQELRGGTKRGSQLTSAPGQPLGWVDPDADA